MDSRITSKTKTILEKIKDLPYFEISDLVSLGIERRYLKIYLFRLIKKGKLISLKKGIYVSREYLDKLKHKNLFNSYLEFLSGVLYSPSFLSLDYILAGFNVLTEFSWHFSAVTRNKTAKFKNSLGLFVYHNVKERLFSDYKIIKKDDFLIYKATKARALFDFLYIRKNLLINKETAKELRLNIEGFSKKEIKELDKYIKIEGSLKMKNIFNWLFS